MHILRISLAVLALLTLPSRGAAQAYDHVIIISVDGLRSDMIGILGESRAPALTTLASGAATLNARTDPDMTVTLPNHTSMMTSRPVQGSTGHNWTLNDDPPPGTTIHSHKGEYIASVFDVAHDHGLRTHLIASKGKFSIFDFSWNAEHGAPDEVSPDHGQDKIDLFVRVKDPEAIAEIGMNAIEQASAEGHRSVTFLHFRQPDSQGHSTGWDTAPDSAYAESIMEVDDALGEIIEDIEKDEVLRASTVIILTADHGGGAPKTSHWVAHDPQNYTIPFLVWSPSGIKRVDLYGINADVRTDPGDRRIPGAPAPDQPIRSADAGNLALALLDLPSIPGSVYGVDSRLRVRAAERGAMGVGRTSAEPVSP